MAKKKNDKNKAQEGPRTILNRRARFDFELHETFEAGLSLTGTEVKSLFMGRANLSDAFCRILNGEIYLMNADIEPYDHTVYFQHERRRDRKLLLHRKQIDMIDRKVLEKSMTIVPTKMYFNSRGKAKVEIALARGKTKFDKRESIAKDETRRDIERVRNMRR